MTFNPAGNVYNPGDNVSVTICFQDYSAGFPSYEKADWDLDNDGNWDINVTGDDGTGITYTALGSGNDLNSSYCVKVEFTAGSQGNLISIEATAKGLTNNCQHTQTQNYTLLPIILESFKVSLKEGTALLNWVTASEFNNDFYTIEMSLDGENYDDIGEVKGAGTTLDRKEYSFEYQLDDNLIANPFIFFRLKQTDFDGLTSHSDVIVLTTGEKDKSTFLLNKVYSDGNDLNIDITSMQTGNVQMRMIDLTGNIIFNKPIGVAKGINNLSIPMEFDTKGIYILQLMTKNKTETKKVFIN